jgi:hypothetical protein
MSPLQQTVSFPILENTSDLASYAKNILPLNESNAETGK